MARTPTGRKAIKYTVVSVVSVLVSLLTLFVTFDVLRVASAGWCQVIACAVGTVPSYTLNRYWAWGKRGRSRLFQEVLPFWVLAFIGLAFSVYAVDLAAGLGHQLKLSRDGVTALTEIASLASYGVLWIGKFVIFNRLLFVDRDVPGGDAEGSGGEGGPTAATPDGDQVPGLSGQSA